MEVNQQVFQILESSDTEFEISTITICYKIGYMTGKCIRQVESFEPYKNSGTEKYGK